MLIIISDLFLEEGQKSSPKKKDRAPKPKSVSKKKCKYKIDFLVCCLHTVITICCHLRK